MTIQEIIKQFLEERKPYTDYDTAGKGICAMPNDISKSFDTLKKVSN
jgi:hypothetical protein